MVNTSPRKSSITNFHFGDYLNHPKEISDPRVLAEAQTALDDFARSVSSFSKIGDFKGIVYSSSLKSWVLLDWTNGHEETQTFAKNEPAVLGRNIYQEPHSRWNAATYRSPKIHPYPSR